MLYMEVTSVSRNKTLTLTYRKYITTNHFQEGAGEPTNGNRREHMIDQDGKADTTKEGNNTTTIIEGKQPPVGDPGKLQGATSQQQAATEVSIK